MIHGSIAWLNVVYSTCGNRSPHHSPQHYGVPRLFKCFHHILDSGWQYWSNTWSPCGLRCRPLWLLVEWSVQLWHVSVQVDWGPENILKHEHPNHTSTSLCSQVCCWRDPKSCDWQGLQRYDPSSWYETEPSIQIHIHRHLLVGVKSSKNNLVPYHGTNRSLSGRGRDASKLPWSRT